jgi:uncharacterized protein YuzE
VKLPTSVEIDIEEQFGYVYYVEDNPEVCETVDVWQEGRVAADLDAAGNVIGIEVLGLDSETLECARRYAAEHDLAFPDSLSP